MEKNNCGFGLIANMDAETAISSLTGLTNRGADGKTGDGCGILIRKPDTFLRIISEENNFDLAKH